MVKEVSFCYCESILAIRNPAMSLRLPAMARSRFADRRSPGPLIHEPPRKTRFEQLRLYFHVDPFDGAPL